MLIHIAHANGIPGASYQPILERLSPHQGFAIAKLGHNPAFPCTDNWRWLSDELIHYIEQHADQPVLGVGHSLGSIVTFISACRRPDLFHGVLMLDPPLFWGVLAWLTKLMKLLKRMDNITPAGKSKFRRQHWPDKAAALDYFASKPLFQFHPECFQAFCDSAVKPDQAGVTLAFDVAVEVEIFRNTPDNLRRLTRPADLPIKLVYADQSNASMEKMVLPFCHHFAIPYQKIVGEHMFPLQQPDLAAELIRDFADRLHHQASNPEPCQPNA